jgi:hypothetical protein
VGWAGQGTTVRKRPHRVWTRRARLVIRLSTGSFSGCRPGRAGGGPQAGRALCSALPGGVVARRQARRPVAPHPAGGRAPPAPARRRPPLAVGERQGRCVRGAVLLIRPVLRPAANFLTVLSTPMAKGLLAPRRTELPVQSVSRELRGRLASVSEQSTAQPVSSRISCLWAVALMHWRDLRRSK